MSSTFFNDIMNSRFNPDAVLDITGGEKVLVISDFHMGNGGRNDDLLRNADLLIDCLEKYYFDGGWYLVLNGDIEELQRNSFSSIYNVTLNNDPLN